MRRYPGAKNSIAFGQSEEAREVICVELDHLLSDRWLQAHPKHQWTIGVKRHEE